MAHSNRGQIVTIIFHSLNPSKNRSVLVIKLRNSWKSISPLPANKKKQTFNRENKAKIRDAFPRAQHNSS